MYNKVTGVENGTNANLSTRRKKDLIQMYLSKCSHWKFGLFSLFLILFSIIYFPPKQWLLTDEITQKQEFPNDKITQTLVTDVITHLLPASAQKTDNVSRTTNLSEAEIDNLSSHLQCYVLPQEDKDVLVLPDYQVKPNSIFFLETSCERINGKIDLSEREACSFEAAARAHIDSEVLVLFPPPITLQNPSPLVAKLMKYPNLKFAHIDLERFVADTPLESFHMLRRLNKTDCCCPVQHVSDILRFLTLWKYGGTYLDTDVLVLRPMTHLENYAAIECEIFINGAILNINISTEIGRHMISSFVSEIRDNYHGDDYIYNGPSLLTRILQRECNESNIHQMTPEKCKGFNVLPAPPASPLYPVTSDEWKRLFEDKISEEMINIVSQKLTIHWYNSRNQAGSPVKKGSNMLYSVLASWLCPEVYSIMSDTF